MGNSSNRDTTDVDRLELESQVIQRRRQGLSFDMIAKELGYANRSGPWKVFQEAKKKLQAEVVESLDDLRWIEHQRNEAILRGGLWMRAQKGEHVAVQDYLAIQKSTREMYGLDAPKRTELTGANGATLLDGLPTGADAARLVREMFGDHAAMTPEIGAATESTPNDPSADAAVDDPIVEPSDTVLVDDPVAEVAQPGR